ncbi:uncharacterized protein N7515_008538 [Penicillium bovifimosum]|uniref:I/LWEQ domain-containing protein n=1 Tax=Penicillium bovifimosum TaxID=126998 RepID=A0A9W9GN59_9EURO|nr:uncharacterized protein N7515_008538 [Penicillium bovifimosum]KAJ5124713.1 hypothetical protein N7515_008538 [Penicillium bovifimosum]
MFTSPLTNDPNDMPPSRCLEILWCEAMQNIEAAEGQILVPDNIVENVLGMDNLQEMHKRLALWTPGALAPHVILAAAIAVTNAISELIKAATESQQEIVREGRGSSSRTAFYKKDNRWTEGLISAAKAVASSANTLIETADGVISGRNSPEQLIVASNDVAASTAQLVAASRVKATFMSKTQDRLETASKAVGSACRALVRQVQDIIKEKNRDTDEGEDYGKLSSHEFKVREMEQQVEILQLENNLARARQRLGEMCKISYQEE